MRLDWLGSALLLNRVAWIDESRCDAVWISPASDSAWLSNSAFSSSSSTSPALTSWPSCTFSFLTIPSTVANTSRRVVGSMLPVAIT